MHTDVYSAREIALAAGASEEQVLPAMRGRRYVMHADAVAIGRALVARERVARASRPAEPLFSIFAGTSSVSTSRPATIPMAVSSTLHAGLLAFAVFVATFNLAPKAATMPVEDRKNDPMRLVFVATPGPGGGGGGERSTVV